MKFTRKWRDGPDLTIVQAVECSAGDDGGRDGELERLRAELTNTQELLGRLVEVLADRCRLGASDVLTIIGARYEIVED